MSKEEEKRLIPLAYFICKWAKEDISESEKRFKRVSKWELAFLATKLYLEYKDPIKENYAGETRRRLLEDIMSTEYTFFRGRPSIIKRDFLKADELEEGKYPLNFKTAGEKLLILEDGQVDLFGYYLFGEIGESNLVRSFESLQSESEMEQFEEAIQILYNIPSEELDLQYLLLDFFPHLEEVESYIKAAQDGEEPEDCTSEEIEVSVEVFDDEATENLLEAFGQAQELNIGLNEVDEDSRTPTLDAHSTDITKNALLGLYDPVRGRDKEVESIIEILSNRKKKNVILTGDPGVGKTAIIMELARRIVNKEVPIFLENKVVKSLDLNSLVSGTMYRGQFEARIKAVIQEVLENPNIIVFIDEIHNLMGSGGNEGRGDAANILKPHLAEGRFQCIGATTIEEFRKYFEKDSALNRRFMKVDIEEPSVEDTVEILKTLKKSYEDFHKVSYPDEILEVIPKLSSIYIPDQFFPDKAVGILDMVGSLAKILGTRRIEDEIRQYRRKVEEHQANKIDFVKVYDLTKAMNERLLEEDAARNAIEKRENLEEYNEIQQVTMEHVGLVISKISGVPVEKILSSDRGKLKTLNKTLADRIIGQDKAVDSVVLSLQRNMLGLRDEFKPMASMLMVGPTGVGKTLICKEMAKNVFGSEANLIRFDMGEFGLPHEVSKLLGTTAGYVGYNESPLLDQVRRRPYSVVLFDEIEKAHPDIYSLFLNILDEGVVTLGNGTKVSFRNTIIVFTGNIGTKELSVKGKPLGFSEQTKEQVNKRKDDIVMRAVEDQFRPEFINRISKIVIFNNLGKDELMKVFDLELNKLRERIKASIGYSLDVSDEVKKLAVENSDPKYGARGLQKEITRLVEDNIARSLIDIEEDQKVDSIKVTLKDQETEDICVQFEAAR